MRVCVCFEKGRRGKGHQSRGVNVIVFRRSCVVVVVVADFVVVARKDAKVLAKSMGKLLLAHISPTIDAVQVGSMCQKNRSKSFERDEHSR